MKENYFLWHHIHLKVEDEPVYCPYVNYDLFNS